MGGAEILVFVGIEINKWFCVNIKIILKNMYGIIY